MVRVVRRVLFRSRKVRRFTGTCHGWCMFSSYPVLFSDVPFIVFGHVFGMRRFTDSHVHNSGSSGNAVFGKKHSLRIASDGLCPPINLLLYGIKEQSSDIGKIVFGHYSGDRKVGNNRV